ncbi:MAG TPA: DUF4153 domain-containing protein [Allosphingosinicella sp.]|nr:DUF4153 domain-containing protein [Allosphingosinicella sp.]
MTDQRTEHAPWPMRAALLALLGALSGLAFDLLIRGAGGEYWSVADSIPRLSLATFIATGGVLFAFTLERARWTWSLAFAIGAGAVLGAVFYWNGNAQARYAYDFWRAFAALLAVAIAAPLFQTMRDEGARRLPYGPVHGHAWANIVLWCAAWAFVLIAFLLAQLLAELFQLIGIHLLRTLLDKSWACWMLVGGTLGGVIGLLRDRDRIVGLLQRVVTTILSVLAPVLAAGLVLFVLALPFTGLATLWEQTRATTPILLACIFGAFVLANAVIGAAPDEEAKSRLLRWSAMALGATMLPLAIVAAISTWLRVAQYGFTPERLWALVFVVIALACALLYLYALVRGREAWAERLRPANIRLAVGICAVSLLLATPLADFGAISTRSQLARLESGRVTPQRFDWRALRFDFGPSGIAALERLRAGGAPEVRRLAAAALAAERPYEMASAEELRAPIERNLRVLPAGTPIPEAVRRFVARAGRCGETNACVLIFGPGPDRASLVSTDADCARCDPRVMTYYRSGQDWLGAPAPRPGDEARHARLDAAVRAGRVEVREVPRRQVFVDGVPVDEAFE